jgi:hypothetical protein
MEPESRDDARYQVVQSRITPISRPVSGNLGETHRRNGLPWANDTIRKLPNLDTSNARTLNLIEDQLDGFIGDERVRKSDARIATEGRAHRTENSPASGLTPNCLTATHSVWSPETEETGHRSGTRCA